MEEICFETLPSGPLQLAKNPRLLPFPHPAHYLQLLLTTGFLRSVWVNQQAKSVQTIRLAPDKAKAKLGLPPVNARLLLQWGATQMATHCFSRYCDGAHSLARPMLLLISNRSEQCARNAGSSAHNQRCCQPCSEGADEALGAACLGEQRSRAGGLLGAEQSNIRKDVAEFEQGQRRAATRIRGMKQLPDEGRQKG